MASGVILNAIRYTLTKIFFYSCLSVPPAGGLSLPAAGRRVHPCLISAADRCKSLPKVKAGGNRKH